MTDEEMLDARLGALLREPNSAPDEAFVTRIARQVEVERRREAARRAAWRRFAGEVLGSAAMLAAFALLYRIAPAPPADAVPNLGPAMAAALLIALWFAVILRPAAARG